MKRNLRPLTAIVVVTVIEILPKEKKQKEEKTMVLGQCSIDLLPVIKGKNTLEKLLLLRLTVFNYHVTTNTM